MVGRMGAGIAESDLTNKELLAFLQDKVLARLASIDTRLATQNGTIATNVKEIATNKANAVVLEKQQQESCIEIARLQERDTHQKERLTETSAAVKDVAGKVWDNATKIAAVAGAVALITKLAELW